MQKILLAYDGTPEADAALDAAAELASAFGAEIGVVSVVPVHPRATVVVVRPSASKRTDG